MEFIENLKLGALEGVPAAIVLLAIILSAVAILIVVIVNGIKALKERKDALEDKQEDEFFAEYGITGEEMRLNQQLTDMKNKLRSKRRIKNELENEPQVVVVKEPVVVYEPVKEEPKVVEEPTPAVEWIMEEPPVVVVEEPISEPVVIPEPEPVVEPEPIVEPEPAPEPEPVKEPEPEPAVSFAPEVPETVVTPEYVNTIEPVAEKQEPISEPRKKKVAPKKAPNKEDNWSNYEGDFEGAYYDPEDACYYEGEPSPELAEKLAKKRAELEAEAKKNKKKVIVKKVAAPFLSLKTPKHERKTPEKLQGVSFDEAVIYGKYVIEHGVDANGADEYYYTLYDPTNKPLYESSNYSSLEYAKRAIARFKTHVLVGEFSIDSVDGKYFYVITRKTYVHPGNPQTSYDNAFKLISKVKNYAQTNIIREQL